MIIKIPRAKIGNEEFKSGNEVLEELKKKFPRFASLNLEEIHVDNAKEKEADKLVFDNSKEEFEKQDKVIFVGGDGTASKEIKRAYKEVFSSLEGFISFDFSEMSNEELEELRKETKENEKKIKGMEIFGIKKQEKEKIKIAVKILEEFLH